MWGFITSLNDILIPYLKSVFNLRHWQAMLVQFAFFGAYFIGSVVYFFISISYGDPINKVGYKKGIIAGLLIAATGCVLFYPAAQLQSFFFFLAALFILALGFTLLQITANPYVAILGPVQTASSRLNLAQAFNSFGTFIAPLLGGYLIYELFGNHPDASSVRYPYLIFALLFILISFIIFKAPLPRFENKETLEKGFGIFNYPQLVLGIIAIFMYVGAEVSIGSIMTAFLGLPEIAGLRHEEAPVYISLYWGGLMIGRFTGSFTLGNYSSRFRNLMVVTIPVITFLFISLIFYLRDFNITGLKFYLLPLVFCIAAFFAGKTGAAKSVLVFAFISVIMLVIALFTTGITSMFAVIGVGLFNSIMWSNIFSLSIQGLRKYTSQGSSLLVMAILGGALIPPIQGYIADLKGVHFSFVVPLLCYLYLLYYGWRMIKQTTEKNDPV